MLDEMKEKFEDSFTDEEKIQIFNLIFSGYYSLSYIRFLAQKKAGRDLGLDVKEPQNLLPPEGEGADYDDYLDAILQQPNKNSILENPNRPEVETDEKEQEEKEEINEDTKIETPVVDEESNTEEEKDVSEVNDEEVQESISDSPISSSPIEGSMLSGELPGAMGPDSSLGDEESEEDDDDTTPEGLQPTRVDDDAVNNITTQEVEDGEDIKEEKVEEKEPLSPTIDNDDKTEEASAEEEDEEKDVITFGFGDSQAGEAHAPTVEVIQEDMRPKKEEVGPQIKFVAPDEVQNQEQNQEQELSNETVVLPTADSSTIDNTVVSSPVVESPISQPSQEVPTITLDQLQNPQGQANPVQ